MNLLFITSLLFFNLLFQPEFTYKIPDLRKVYSQATKDKETYEQLAKHLADYKGNEVMVLGFQAGIQGVGAKYARGFYAKLKQVRTSAHLFEEVLKKDADNPEVRFLRYTIEYHIPRYLLMSGNLQDDKRIILNSLHTYPRSGIDAEAFRIMREYFLRGDHCSAEEKMRLRALKA